MRKFIIILLLLFAACGHGEPPQPSPSPEASPCLEPSPSPEASVISRGPLSAGTGANVAHGTVAGWGSLSNITTSNDAYSDSPNLGVGDITQYLKATNFGFSIPPDALIRGVFVEVERNKTGALATIQDESIKLVKGGSVSGNDKAAGASWPSSDAYASFGSSSDLWGLTLTPSDINSSTFGVVVACQNNGTGVGRGFVDHIRITVYYDLPGDFGGPL